MGSFNTFGKTSKAYGQGKNIWHEIKGAYPVGGTIANLSAYKAGDVIPAVDRVEKTRRNGKQRIWYCNLCDIHRNNALLASIGNLWYNLS